jgi:hypothetical protein
MTLVAATLIRRTTKKPVNNGANVLKPRPRQYGRPGTKNNAFKKHDQEEVMEKKDNEILIPFELHALGHTGVCQDVMRQRFELAKALINENEHRLISLQTYTLFHMEMLEAFASGAIESQLEVDVCFYAYQATLMLHDWEMLVNDLINMRADREHMKIGKEHLTVKLSKLIDQQKMIMEHAACAKKLLFDNSFSFPTIDSLKEQIKNEEKRASNAKEILGGNSKL